MGWVLRSQGYKARKQGVKETKQDEGRVLATPQQINAGRGMGKQGVEPLNISIARHT
jgi:hypothetical protein